MDPGTWIGHEVIDNGTGDSLAGRANKETREIPGVWYKDAPVPNRCIHRILIPEFETSLLPLNSFQSQFRELFPVRTIKNENASVEIVVIASRDARAIPVGLRRPHPGIRTSGKHTGRISYRKKFSYRNIDLNEGFQRGHNLSVAVYIDDSFIGGRDQ